MPPRGIPDAAPGLPPPRLPSLDGIIPADPPQQPLAARSKREDIETYQTVVTLDFNLGSVASVYTTQRPWSGIDVFVAPIVPQQTYSVSNLRVLVYSVGENAARAVVAQGSVGATRLSGAGAQSLPVFACSARSLASRFEVVVSTETVGVALNPVNIQVTIVASDKALSLPSPNDSAYFRSNDIAPFFVNGTLLGGVENARTVGACNEPLFIRGLHAVNGAAAARYIQVFDTGITLPANGTAPVFSFLLTALGTAGSELHIDADGPGGELLRDQAFFVGPFVTASSTPGTLTRAIANVFAMGFLR